MLNLLKNTFKKVDGVKTYVGVALVMLSLAPWDDEVKHTFLVVGLSLAGIGLRHAISKGTTR